MDLRESLIRAVLYKFYVRCCNMFHRVDGRKIYFIG